MKPVFHAALGLALACATPAFAAGAAPTAAKATAAAPAHVKAVQDLLSSMEAEKVLLGVASRSHYQSQDQRKAVLAKVGKIPPAEVYRRMAPALAASISADTAAEMTRFYNTPYGRKVIYRKYNSAGGIVMPGAARVETVAPEEKQERKRAAYVKASKELAAADPAIEHEAFKLLQAINREPR
jgi:hypothetical protein